MRALPWKEDMLPRVAADGSAIEYHHFVAVDVGLNQLLHGDVAHVQRSLVALEYQGLADGILMALTQAPSWCSKSVAGEMRSGNMRLLL
jgi:hypothetical protein